VTGTVSGEREYQAIALALLQLCINDFVNNHKGFDLGKTSYGTYVAKKHLFWDDKDDFVIDGSSWISQQVMKVVPKTALEHPFLFRVLPNDHLLIGIDERDLECPLARQ
jgi:hypothetical protein